MAMMKSIASTLQCVYHIQDYLEKNNRAIARDFLNFSTDLDHTRNWSYFFDKTRAKYGNDKRWGGKDPVTYQHFIVSPDPRDEVNIDTLRAFVTEWAKDLFGGGKGSLGMFQVAIVYHDDNKRGIPHAHVVVNSTNLETRKRLHISNTQNKFLATHLQDLALKYGLTAFENDSPAKLEPTLKVKRTAAENAIRKERKFGWKQELRNVADIAVRTSDGIPQFLDACAAYGVEVSVSRSDMDFVYAHPANPTRWRCSGKQLGESYVPRAIRERIEQVRPRIAALREKMRPNVLAAAPEAKLEEVRTVADASKTERRHATPEEKAAALKAIRDACRDAERVAVVDRSVSVAQVASTLRTVERFGIRCQADFLREMQGIQKSLAIARKQNRLDPEIEQALNEQYARLAAAKRVAEKSMMFKGIEDPGMAAANVPGSSARPRNVPGSKTGKASSPQQRSRNQRHAAGKNPSSSPNRRGGGREENSRSSRSR
ncbi:relaxase/mobilization nuclease domain-containing protein [Senegalimassilia anaerobia]|uniref:relaxase/mobilization nuclease domain-containing protein n=1 Tax=Senegalimassilia anaerobia TaxID=1473216 RepID=UPI003A97EF2A